MHRALLYIFFVSICFGIPAASMNTELTASEIEEGIFLEGVEKAAVLCFIATGDSPHMQDDFDVSEFLAGFVRPKAYDWKKEQIKGNHVRSEALVVQAAPCWLPGPLLYDEQQSWGSLIDFQQKTQTVARGSKETVLASMIAVKSTVTARGGVLNQVDMLTQGLSKMCLRTVKKVDIGPKQRSRTKALRRRVCPYPNPTIYQKRIPRALQYQ
ncbi:MAG TPA: hypothetical protein VGT41_06305 [Candidatus Babeliales bacterium]|nr:hypothetical protein [Candidatus Babeliales bacterium]